MNPRVLSHWPELFAPRHLVVPPRANNPNERARANLRKILCSSLFVFSICFFKAFFYLLLITELTPIMCCLCVANHRRSADRCVWNRRLDQSTKNACLVDAALRVLNLTESPHASLILPTEISVASPAVVSAYYPSHYLIITCRLKFFLRALPYAPARGSPNHVFARVISRPWEGIGDQLVGNGTAPSTHARWGQQTDQEHRFKSSKQIYQHRNRQRQVVAYGPKHDDECDSPCATKNPTWTSSLSHALSLWWPKCPALKQQNAVGAGRQRRMRRLHLQAPHVGQR